MNDLRREKVGPSGSAFLFIFIRRSMTFRIVSGLAFVSGIHNPAGFLIYQFNTNALNKMTLPPPLPPACRQAGQAG